MRKIPWGIIFLVLWANILGASVTFYLKYLQPAQLSNTISLYFKDYSNLYYNSERVSLVFFPEPSIQVLRGSLTDNQGSFVLNVEKAKATLSWRSLLRAKPVFKSIEIFAPKLDLRIPKTPTQETKKALHSIKNISEKNQQILVQNAVDYVYNRLLSAQLPPSLAGLNAYMRAGDLQLHFEDSTDSLNIQGIDIDANFPGFLDGSLDIRVQKTHISMDSLPEFSFTQSAFILSGWQLNSNTIEGNFMVQTKFQMGSLQKFMDGPIQKAYQYFPMPVPARIRLQNSFSITKNIPLIKSDGLFQTRIILPMSKHNTPISIDAPFSFASTNKKTRTKNLIIPPINDETAYHVNAFLKGNANLPQEAIKASSLYVEHIKVKNVNINMGNDGIILNGKLLGIYPLSPLFQGHIKIRNFSLPRWVGPSRSMSGGLMKALDQIKGETDIIVNQRGALAYNLFAGVYDIRGKGIASCGNFLKPDVAINLTVIQNKNNDPINLNQLFPEINSIKFAPVKLPPPAVAVRTPEDTSIPIFVDYHIAIRVPHVDIWKLSAKDAYCLISPNKIEDPTIKITVNDLYTGSAVADIVLAKGVNHIEARLDNIDIGQPIQEIAGFDAVNGKLDTTLTFEFSGSIIEEVLSTLKISIDGILTNGIIRDDTKTTIQKFQSIQFSASAKAFNFYKKTKVLPPLFTMTGDYSVYLREHNTSAKISTSATLDFSTDNGLPLRMIPQSSKIEYYYVGNNKSDQLLLNGFGMLGYDQTQDTIFTLENFRGTLNHEKLQGNLYIKNTERTIWNGVIRFDEFDIDNYIKSTKGITGEPTKLPIQFLKYNDLDFVISSKKLILLDTAITNFHTKIKAQNGQLQIGTIRGTLPTNGELKGIIKASVIPGHLPQDDRLSTEIRLQAKDLDLLAVSKMRHQDYNIAGLALIKLDMHGIFKTTKDILANLNGEGSLAIKNGYFQSSKIATPPVSSNASEPPPLGQQRNAQPKSNKTSFDSILASGTIKEGIFTEKVFDISGPGLKVTGGGTINLVTQAIDASVIATFFDIPEIPIHISGTITDPKIDTKVLSAVANTLGNIGVNTVELVGVILTMPFKLLSKILTP